MEKTSGGGKKSLPIIGIVVFFFIIIAILGFGYYYLNSRNDVVEIQPDTEFGVPIFDPTADSPAVASSLKDKIVRAKKLDTNKLQEIESLLPSKEQGIYHTAEIDIQHGGVVTNIIYDPNAIEESAALFLTINSATDPSVSYSVSLTKKEIGTLNIFLSVPYEAPLVVGVDSIEAGDLIIVHELTDLLESGRGRIVAIQIEKSR